MVVHIKLTIITSFMAAEATCFALWQAVFVVLPSQLYCYVCIHSILPVQNSGIPLPAKHPDADTM